MRAVLAGVVWAAAMAAAGEGIPMYREWDAEVRFDGLGEGEIGVDEELRRELRAGPIREGIMGRELVLDLTGGGGSWVKVVGGASAAWQAGAANTKNDQDAKKKEDDGWILSAIRQADGSSSNRTSLGTWLAGEGNETQNGWGWLAGGVQADAEGRMADAAAAMKAELQEFNGEFAEGTIVERPEAEKNDAGAMDVLSDLPGQEAEKTGEMSRTREALEMAGMQTGNWKSKGGDRRFAPEGLGVDWKTLTAGGATGGSKGEAEEKKDASDKDRPVSSRVAGFGETEGNGQGWGMRAEDAGVAGEWGTGTGIGAGTESRERWGGGWVVGGGNTGGSGFGGSGVGWNGDGGGGWNGSGGFGQGAGAGTGRGTTTVPIRERSEGGAVWEAWQKRGENSGGGFAPAWR